MQDFPPKKLIGNSGIGTADFWRGLGGMFLVILAVYVAKSMFFAPVPREQNISVSGFEFVLPDGWYIPSKSDLQKVKSEVDDSTTTLLFMASKGRNRGEYVFLYVFRESLDIPDSTTLLDTVSADVLAEVCSAEKDSLPEGTVMRECERKRYKTQGALKIVEDIPSVSKELHGYIFLQGGGMFRLNFLMPSGCKGVHADMEKIADSVK